jgi:hypothetical protein
MYKFLYLIVLFFLFSCSSEEPADLSSQKPLENGKGVISSDPQQQAVADSAAYSLEITPVDATRNSTFNVTPKDFNLQDARIIWLLNGNPVSVVMLNQFKASDAKKGDTVQAKVLIQDKEIFSNTVTIKNAPPELTKVKLMPEVFKIGDRWYIDASASDTDEDPVAISYEWTMNGEPAGNTKEIGAHIKRGDKISVKITPFDGEAYGKPVTLRREIGNMPPMVAEDKKHIFDGRDWTYQIKATDPDGDPLTYSLKSAPQGMTIEPSTGLIKWDVPPEFKGKTPVTVSVTDGHGGDVIQSFTLEILPSGR